jgi:hypothetical protein
LEPPSCRPPSAGDEPLPPALLRREPRVGALARVEEAVAVPADQEEVGGLEGESGGDALNAYRVDVVGGPGVGAADLAPLAPLGADGHEEAPVPGERGEGRRGRPHAPG